jgi:hypothetical protein
VFCLELFLKKKFRIKITGIAIIITEFWYSFRKDRFKLCYKSILRLAMF